MWDDLVGREIARCNRNLILLNVTILAAVSILVWANSRYLSNCIFGPFALSPQALTAITDSASLPHYFVAVHGDDAVDTGGTEIEQKTSDSGEVVSTSTTAHYLALRFGSNFLVVKSASDSEKRLDYTGALVPLPSDVNTSVILPLIEQVPQAKNAFVPVLLDTGSFRSDSYIGLALCFPFVLLACWNLRKAAQRVRRPELSPTARRLSRYGDLDTLAHQIDQQLGETGIEKIGPARLSVDWLMQPGSLVADFLCLPEAVWIYEKITKRRINGIIPAGKNYAVEILDSRGQTLSIGARRGKVEALLQTLHGRVPWAIAGYSDEIQALAKNNFAALAQAVTERRNSQRTSAHT